MTYRSESLTLAAAERIVRHYRGRAVKSIEAAKDREELTGILDTRKLSDTLMDDLFAALRIEGADMPRAGLRHNTHKWRAVAFALFAVEMLETAHVLNGRQWGRMYHCRELRPLKLRLNSHAYILGVYQTGEERAEALAALESVLGEIPSDLGRWE